MLGEAHDTIRRLEGEKEVCRSPSNRILQQVDPRQLPHLISRMRSQESSRAYLQLKQRVDNIDLGQLVRDYQEEQRRFSGPGGRIMVAYSDARYEVRYHPLVTELIKAATGRSDSEVRAVVGPATGPTGCGLLIYVHPSSYQRFDNDADRLALEPYRAAGECDQ